MLVELHCHSKFSDGLPSPKQIMEKASRDLGAIAITDHNTQAGLREARKTQSKAILIPGVEITCTHGEKKSHVLALGIEEFKQGDVFDVLDFVKSSGGVSIMAHPFRGFGYSFFDRKAWKLADAIEVLNGGTIGTKNAMALDMARRMKLSMTSGSDAHWLKFVGRYACEIPGHDVESILKSIRKGKAVLSTRGTSAASILLHGTVRKSRIKMRKLARF